MREIERKFLIETDKIPSLTVHDYQHIVQGYPNWSFDSFVYRLRMVEHRLIEKEKLMEIKYYQTFKEVKAKSRLEIEVELLQSQFEPLSKLCEYVLEKQRYEIPTKNNIIELDIYLNDLSGLVIAEVEFNTELECNAYIPEPWFGKEVTDDNNYSNYMLAKNRLPK